MAELLAERLALADQISKSLARELAAVQTEAAAMLTSDAPTVAVSWAQGLMRCALTLLGMLSGRSSVAVPTQPGDPCCRGPVRRGFYR